MIALAYPTFYEAFAQHIPNLKVATTKDGNIDTSILVKADKVIFTGGSDINPAIYGEKNKNSYCDLRRDQAELEILDLLLGPLKNVKALGVCRGHQLICARVHRMKLIQDIWSENLTHNSYHPLEYTNKSKLDKIFESVNSMHHQGVKYSSLPVDQKSKVTSVYNDVVESTEVGRFLTVQFHPEFMRGKAAEAFFSFIQKEW